MALTQTNRLVWLITTIRKAGKITFKELSDKWRDNEDMSKHKDLSRRSFQKWKQDCADRFGIFIFNENKGDYRYYISDSCKLRDGSVQKWLFDTNAIGNQLMENKKVSDRIILEDIPSNQEYLQPIIDAMKENRLIHITYYNYWRGDERQHYVMPLCVKLFRQRWYFVGRAWSTGMTLVFCLDRIRSFRLSSHTFEYPEDFSPQEYFKGCMGVIVDEDTDIETVRLKVSNHQSNYLRDLPLHGARQREVECNEEYSIFEMDIRPTFDFQQEILWNGEDVEVISPLWLRKEIAGKVKRMWNKYSNN